ncbi:MAG TPA: hypothetical protein VK574_12915 [Terracidiphilus sp.]|nr:hypothetical protein [Terracidiphilus sp.]
MKDLYLLAYQLIAGVSDASTGALLIAAPVFTVRLMGLSAPRDAAPFLSFIGSFVFAVGLSYLYGALLIHRTGSMPRLEAVWLLTAIIRSSVAIFVLVAVLTGTLALGWITIALFDCICVLIQARGLHRGWLSHVTH